MGRAGLAALVLLLTACGGQEKRVDPSRPPCSDVAFRAQDEELYVTESAIANAVGRAGAPAALVLDLRRARAALSAYLDAHRPCALDLVEIAGVEHGALTSLEAAIAALADGADAGAQLETARVMLRRVASSLAGGT